MAFQEQLLAELERIQLELDQLRGRPGSSYSRLDTTHWMFLGNLFQKSNIEKKNTVSLEKTTNTHTLLFLVVFSFL